MKFLVYRSSTGPTSEQPPCRGAVRGPASSWPGEFSWFIELNSLEELTAFLEENEGALGLFAPEPDEDQPAIEIFDEDDEDE